MRDSTPALYAGPRPLTASLPSSGTAPPARRPAQATPKAQHQHRFPTLQRASSIAHNHFRVARTPSRGCPQGRSPPRSPDPAPHPPCRSGCGQVRSEPPRKRRSPRVEQQSACGPEPTARPGIARYRRGNPQSHHRVPKSASGSEITKSAPPSSAHPPAIAPPCTAATTGQGSARSARMAADRPASSRRSASRLGSASTTARSNPEQNIGPLPVRSRARQSAAPSMAARRASTISGVSAFRRSGLSSRMVRTPPLWLV